MDAKTLEALKKSIKKWNKKRVVDHGGDNCALCEEFADNLGCAGCPVSEATNVFGCWETPYMDWARHHEREHSAYFPHITHTNCQTCKDLQQAELDFLKSLLPEEVTK